MIGTKTLLAGGAILAAIAFALAGTAAMFAAGPWYDEIYTLWVTRPGQPVIDQFGEHWMADNHPPLFYALSRATAWLGTEVQPRRLVNLAFLAMAATALIAMARRIPHGKVIASLAAPAILAAPDAIDKLAELRSTFLTMAAAAAALTALLALGAPGQPRERPLRDFAMLAAALMLAFNVHLVTSVIVGAIAGAFAGWLMLARDWAGLRRLLLAGTMAATPLLLTTAAQLRTIEANTRSFWIAGGFDAGRWEIEKVVISAIGANAVVTLAGLAGAALLAMRAIGSRWLDPRLAAMIAIGTGCAVALAVLLALHSWRPILQARYLLALVPAIALMLGLGGSALVERLGRWPGVAFAALATLATALGMAGALVQTTHRPSWNDTGRAIAAAVRACPGTVVHADMEWNRPVTTLMPRDNALAVPFGYRTVARQLGFTLEPYGSRRMASHCPTIFWTEHVAALSPSADEVAERLRTRGFALGTVRLLRPSRGWILVSVPR